MPDITQYCPETLFLLVGTQADLLNDVETPERLSENNQNAVTPEMGQELARARISYVADLYNLSDKN